jgi:hypothetical protein
VHHHDRTVDLGLRGDGDVDPVDEQCPSEVDESLIDLVSWSCGRSVRLDLGKPTDFETSAVPDLDLDDDTVERSDNSSGIIDDLGEVRVCRVSNRTGVGAEPGEIKLVDPAVPPRFVRNGRQRPLSESASSIDTTVGKPRRTPERRNDVRGEWVRVQGRPPPGRPLRNTRAKKPSRRMRSRVTSARVSGTTAFTMSSAASRSAAISFPSP